MKLYVAASVAASAIESGTSSSTPLTALAKCKPSAIEIGTSYPTPLTALDTRNQSGITCGYTALDILLQVLSKAVLS